MEVRKISTKKHEEKIIWTGNCEGNAFTVVGTMGIPIKPIVDPNPPQNMGKYHFDKQLIQDTGVHLTISKQSRTPSASSASGYSKENNGK